MAASPPKPLALTEEQVLWFRARRSHLAGSGAASPRRAAADLLGAQAQQEGPALFALSQRTAGRPTAAELQALLTGDDRTLVRTWGQRDTLHVYDPDDWAAVVAARRRWPQSGRRAVMPTAKELAIARRLFERADRPLFRTDLFDSIPQRYVDEVAAFGYAGAAPVRLAAARLVWRLAMEGEVCFAVKSGAEQSYVHRRLWFPELDWPRLDPDDAATELTRRYLATWGPATAADAAHFFGAKVTAARGWLERLAGERLEIACEGRTGLTALATDETALRETPPAGKAWPPRLLPKWDTQTMTHRDKSWVLPEAGDQKAVWRKAADVSATVVARGRIVAVWTHKATASRLTVTVTPLDGWRAKHLPAVRREARALAAHLGVAGAAVEVGDPHAP